MTLTLDTLRLPASVLRAMLVRKEISPVELIQATLENIERHNPRINAVCTLSDKAMDDARELEKQVMRGDQPGPLFGLPAGIKDVTPVKHLRTTYGCAVYKDHHPKEDALIVQRLRKAGAVIIGKTNTPEFATGGNTFNDIFGLTRNPWNPELSAGGSTGGGAAGLATGMIAIAEGTDLGGSLRIPASFCGIAGLRPSPGLVPTWPSEYMWDTMQVTGTLGRTAADIAMILQAIAGPSPLSPIGQSTQGRDFSAAVSKGISQGCRIAYCADTTGIGIDEQVGRICRDAAFALKDAGAIVEEVDIDLSFGWQAFLAIRGFWMVAQQSQRLEHLDQFGPNLKGNIEAGLKLDMLKLGEAEHVRGRMWMMFAGLFQKYDAVLTPCMAVPPFPATENYPQTIAGKKMNTYIDWVAPTFILSMLGLPVASAPCGLTAERLPVGLQIVGPQNGEEVALTIAARIQSDQKIGLPEPATWSS